MFDDSDLLTKVRREFISGASATASNRSPVGSFPCQGVYVTPISKQPKVAFIATHYNIDYTELYVGPYLASRGYGFLGWNTRYRDAEDKFILEHALIDISVGLRWLREKAGVEIIVLLGKSGAASLMAAYQAEATDPTLHTRMTGEGSAVLQNLPQADLYVSFNGHEGRPTVITSIMDPSVTDESDALSTDESLNPFNSRNGPPYSAEFIERYRKAQRARNQRITDWAKIELTRLNDSGRSDRTFPINRCWADLRSIDATIDPSDRRSPSCFLGDPAVANRQFGRVSTLATWLSMWSLETSKCQAAEQLAKFNIPALVVQGLGDVGVFPTDARRIFESIGSADKELRMVPGPHFFEDSREERNAAIDVLTDWAAARS